jgi:hypothetical protein
MARKYWNRFANKEGKKLFIKISKSDYEILFQQKDIPNNQHFEKHAPKGGEMHMLACKFLKNVREKIIFLKGAEKGDGKKYAAFI